MAPAPPRIDPDIERQLGDLAGSSALYPFRFDPLHDTILFLQATPALFRTASFLDERMVPKNAKGAWVPLARVQRLIEGAGPTAEETLRPLHFIFHISHCGSTMLSRLLDLDTRIHPLREPLPLRDLAVLADDLDTAHGALSQTGFADRLALFMRLWRRAAAPAQTVVLKATSAAQRLAPQLLAARKTTAPKAVTLFLPAEAHIATLLAGPNNLIDMRAWARERMIRLARLAGPPPSPLHALSPGELSAMTWAAERLTQHGMVQDCGSAVLDLDFEDLLSAPEVVLTRVAAHFGLDPDANIFKGAAQSPAMTQYAKAPEHAYGPGLRADVLKAARTEHGSEIAKGLKWLDRYAAVSQEVSKVLSEKAPQVGHQPTP